MAFAGTLQAVVAWMLLVRESPTGDSIRRKDALRSDEHQIRRPVRLGKTAGGRRLAAMMLMAALLGMGLHR